MAASSQSLAVGPRDVAPAQTLARRPDGRAIRSDALCAGGGTGSFIGGDLGNVAGGVFSGILSGYGNQEWGPYDAVGAGLANEIFANGGADTGSFIGGGYYNKIYSNGLGGTYESFIGAGNSNVVTAWEAGIGAGLDNLVGPAGATSFVGGGASNTSNGEYMASSEPASPASPADPKRS
jgi:hypothetical protein